MRESEVCVLLLLLSSVQCLCDCPLSATSTSCGDTKPRDNIPDIQGAPPSDGSCEFDISFCNYTQGCRDPAANDWTSPGSFAEVKGRNGLAAQYSVLQSPLLRIDHITCFKFNASVGNPSRLSVYFGKKLDSSCTVKSEVAPGQTVNLNENINIHPAMGKIFFWGKSGGNANGYVRLHSVSLVTGRCEDPQCSFENAFNGRACDHWEWNGWNVTSVTQQSTGLSGKVAALGPGLLAGTLKTDLLMATGTQTACLQFRYKMTGINDTLAVSVQHEDGRTELMWQATYHNESISWPHATVPLLFDNAFFIIFQGQRCRTQESTDTAIDDVQVLRPSSCDYRPQGSKPSSQQLTSASDPSCDLLPTTTTFATITSETSHLATTTTSAKVTKRETFTTISVTSDLSKTNTSAQVTERETSTTSSAASDPPTPMPDDSSQTDSAEKDSNISVIVGAIAGVVVLAGIGIVLAVVIWRIPKGKSRGSKDDTLNSTYGSGDGGLYNSEPSRETAAAPDIPSATETYYEGLGELSPQSHYTSLVGTESASHAAASYYNIESTTQAVRNGLHKTSTTETQYEGLGEPSPPSVYTSLQNTAAASDTGKYYSNDFAQDNRSYYNVAPGNNACYTVVKDPHNVKT